MASKENRVNSVNKHLLASNQAYNKVFRLYERALSPADKLLQNKLSIMYGPDRFTKALWPSTKLQEELAQNGMYSAIQKITSSTAKILEHIEEVNEQTPENLKILAEYGWYLSMDTSFDLPIELGEKLKGNEVDYVDTYLVQYYTEHLDDIFEELIVLYPNRGKLFQQILDGHKNGQYFTSIPALFAQIDGICKDVAAESFFIKLPKGSEFEYRPKLVTALKDDIDDSSKAFFSAIYCDTPAIAHESNLRSFPCQLNRHAIIHGEDTEYGTLTNSLKCISLLKYVSDILDSTFDLLEVRR